MHLLHSFVSLSVLLVTLVNAQRVEDSCPQTYQAIVAHPRFGCDCQRPINARADGRTVCRDGLPGNARAFCTNTGTGSRASSTCDWECQPGFRREGRFCISGTTPGPDPETTPGPGPGPRPEPDTFPRDAGVCPAHVPGAYSSPTRMCDCFRRPPAAASYPGSVRCNPPPSGNGDPRCINLSATSSECGFTCHTGHRLNPAGTDCVPTAPPPGPLILPEDRCSTEAGTYLIADPVLGCRCSTTPEAGWCGLPTPDSAAMSCRHDAGPTNARCFVTDCPDDMEPSTTNPAECVERDGTLGRMNANTDCPAGNVYALPGRAGCRCVPTGSPAPTGARHCNNPPEHGWGICSFLTVTTPARCLIGCESPYAAIDGNCE